MSVRIEGFDGFSEKVEELQQRTNAIEGESEVQMTELFRPDFMQSYTEFETFEEFLDESPWTVNTQSDFERIPSEKFDKYVDKHTGFDSWEMMLSVAGREWVARQLTQK